MERFFHRQQPIALPETTDKDPLIEAESVDLPGPGSASREACQCNKASQRKKLKSTRAARILTRLFLTGIFLYWVIRAARIPRKISRFLHRNDSFQTPFFGHEISRGTYMLPSEVEHRCSSLALWSRPFGNVDENEQEETKYEDANFKPLFFAATSFTFSSSDSLVFFSTGAPSFGHITFMEDATVSVNDTVVDVSVLHKNKDALDHVDVCALDRSQGAGLGIFASRRKRHGKLHEELSFDISVRYSKSSDNESIVKDLKTILPGFGHFFEPDSNLHFNSLDVRAYDFRARDCGRKFRTPFLWGSIEGNFKVTQSLTLSTSNAPINVNVIMENADKGVPTIIKMTTSNSPLMANLSLYSTGPGGTGGEFSVQASTFNSPLDIQVPVAPVDSILSLSGSTSNSAATLSLPPTYEGSFHLVSSVLKPKVDIVEENVEDPAGEGRTRKVTFLKVNDHQDHWPGDGMSHEIIGDVYWKGGDGSDEDEKKGDVTLHASILAAELKL